MCTLFVNHANFYNMSSMIAHQGSHDQCLKSLEQAKTSTFNVLSEVNSHTAQTLFKLMKYHSLYTCTCPSA